MLRIAGWVSILALATACSGGGGDATAVPGSGGTMPTASSENTAPTVTATSLRIQTGTAVSTSIAAMDADGDTITFDLISGPDWLSLSSDGALSGTPAADDVGTSDLIVDVSDGTDTTRATIELITFMDAVEQAMLTGDFTFVTEHSDIDLEALVLEEIQAIRTRDRNAINEIYELNADGTLGENSITGITWNTPRTSSHMGTRFANSFPLIQTTEGPRRNLAVLGEALGARYAVLSNSIGSLGEYEANAPNSRMLKNTIDWLVQTDTTDELNVVIAQLGGEFEHNRATAFLDAAFPDRVSYNTVGACDGGRFESCMTDDVDIVILMQYINSGTPEDAVIEQIQPAMNRGVAMILIPRHFNSDNNAFGQRIKDLIRSGGSSIIYPFNSRTVNWSPVDVLDRYEPDYVARLESIIEGIRDESLDYDLSVCAGPIECWKNAVYRVEVYNTLTSLRGQILNPFSREVGDPFIHPDHDRLVAALTLLGDFYRSMTSFPMPKASTPSDQLIRAQMGEYANIVNRTSVPVMPDLGTYSNTEFESVTLGDATVSFNAGLPFHATGLYALPGETVTVTRTDAGRSDADIHINALSTTTSSPFLTFDDTQYSRPVLVTEGVFPISPYEFVMQNGVTTEKQDSFELVSPYGGPIHIYPGHAADEVALSFSNVAQHPVWRAPEDNEQFLIDLASDDFSWAEILTPHFAVLSRADQMKASLDNDRYGSGTDLGQTTATYLNDWPRWFDGQSGDGVRENEDLQAFLDRHDLQIDTPQTHVQRYIVDRSICDPTCFGAPITSSAPFDPMAFDLHDHIGTSLAKKLIGTAGPRSDAVSDLYVSHSFFRWHQETDEVMTECPQLPHQDMYAVIQDGEASGDPITGIAGSQTSGTAEQNAFYIQLMAALENQSALDEGWALWPRYSAVIKAFQL
ncbi:MAG: ImpA family metalloprotease, partial [Pseudomonadota bacterium]